MSAGITGTASTAPRTEAGDRLSCWYSFASKAVGARGRRAQRERYAATIRLVAGLGCVVAAAPALGRKLEILRIGECHGDVHEQRQLLGDEPGGRRFRDLRSRARCKSTARGARLKLNGSIGATATLYAGQTENNSFAPQCESDGKLEAIENFAFVDAQASVSQTFLSPFGAQPSNTHQRDPEPLHAADLCGQPLHQGRFRPPATSPINCATTITGRSRADSAIHRRTCPVLTRTA